LASEELNRLGSAGCGERRNTGSSRHGGKKIMARRPVAVRTGIAEIRWPGGAPGTAASSKWALGAGKVDTRADKWAKGHFTISKNFRVRKNSTKLKTQKQYLPTILRA
jgi:hypothetical protein